MDRVSLESHRRHRTPAQNRLGLIETAVGVPLLVSLTLSGNAVDQDFPRLVSGDLLQQVAIAHSGDL